MVGKKAVLMLVLLSLGLVAGTFQPAQSVKTATIDFEGLAEGDIVSSLRHGAGISGDVIAGEVSVFGSNPAFDPTNAAMIFDATCAGGCSGGDDDLHFDELGNGLIISEDLDSSDPDDAESPGDFYFEFDFSNFGNAKVNLKKLVYADIDGNEPPGLIEVYKGSQLIKEVDLPRTGNNATGEASVDANDIDRLVVRFYGSMMIDNIEIEIETNGLYTIYLPMGLVPEPPKFDVTIGYEDRGLADEERLDYDYNDWAISIVTEFDWVLVDEGTIELEKITFKMEPKARGGKIDHQFHLRIDANTFKSDGDYELVIKGEPGVDVHDPKKGSFIASKENDIPIIFLESGCDCEAFGDGKGEPDKYNVKDGKDEPGFRRIEAIRWAELSITFDTPFEFDLPRYEAHCQGLFFDPYLKVDYDGKSDEISRTPNINDPNPDPRILCVPDPKWQWPEEMVRIDRAYPDVTFTEDKPPRPVFPPEWYLTPPTICVFGDGIPCP